MTHSGASHHAARLNELADARLVQVDQLVTGSWATPVVWRQPIHTCYVPAGVFKPDAPASWSSSALATLASTLGATDNATDEALKEAAEALAAELGIRESDIESVAELTIKKLLNEPIEDLRIDFEDGFTQREVPVAERDADEDARALSGAKVLAEWFKQRFSSTSANADASASAPAFAGSAHAPAPAFAGSAHAPAPAFAGIRFKSFDPAVRNRGLRTLVIVLDELNEQGVLKELYNPASDNYDPRALRLTFPKVQHHLQVETLVELLAELERDYGLDDLGGKIRFEVQVETPQAIVGKEGESEAAKIIAAAQGRCLSLHYGTYDYSASMGVDAAQQSMEHPVADHAKDMLQVATAAVGVELSDGSTNRIPAGDRESILAGWRLHFRLVTRHLHRGVRQGWDLHGNQLVTRHMATIAYFRENWEETAQRLKAYLAGDTSRWMDEPATAKAMAGYLRRAHSCGAITDAELATAGVSAENLAKLQATGRI